MPLSGKPHRACDNKGSVWSIDDDEKESGSELDETRSVCSDASKDSIISIFESHSRRITPCDHLLIVIAVFLPSAGLLLGMSAIGYGLEVYDAVAPVSLSVSGDGCMIISALYCIILFVLDWPHWNLARQVYSLIPPWLLGCMAMVLKGRRAPWAPPLTVIFHKWLFIGLLRVSTCRNVGRREFFKSVTASTLLSSVAQAMLWVWWRFSGHVWNDDSRAWMAARGPAIYHFVYSGRPLNYTADCGPQANISQLFEDEMESVMKACSQAGTIMFIIWFCPLLGLAFTLLASQFVYLSGVHFDLRDATRFQHNTKTYFVYVVAVVMGIYGSVTISGQSVELGGTMLAFFSFLLVFVLGWMYLELGPGNVFRGIQKELSQYKLLEMIWNLHKSEWVQAGVVIAFNVLIPLFFGLDTLRQTLRKLRPALVDVSRSSRAVARGVPSPPPADDIFTIGARYILEEMGTWHLPMVFSKVCLIGEMFFVMQVGIAKLTAVFLSWVNQELRHWDYGMVIVIVFGVGYLLFLIPPVPGVPIYVFCGVVLAKQAERTDFGFWGGCIIAVAVAFALKLSASVGQYGMGYWFGRFVKVQQLIGVDTVPTRAVEAILKRPGWSVGKVSVLVGAPDWPTSVTCGILGMNVWQMILGTLPVFFVNGPCVLSGAFMTRGSREGGPGDSAEMTWQAWAHVCIIASAAVLSSTGLLAVLAIAQEIESNSIELAQLREEHRAVAELTRAEESEVARYREATAWPNLGGIQRIVIGAAAALMLVSVLSLGVLSRFCFLDFSLSGDIKDAVEDGGLGGNVWNIVVKPFGWFFVALFSLAVVLHLAFVFDASCRAKSLPVKDAKHSHLELVAMVSSS